MIDGKRVTHAQKLVAASLSQRFRPGAAAIYLLLAAEDSTQKLVTLPQLTLKTPTYEEWKPWNKSLRDWKGLTPTHAQRLQNAEKPSEVVWAFYCVVAERENPTVVAVYEPGSSDKQIAGAFSEEALTKLLDSSVEAKILDIVDEDKLAHPDMLGKLAKLPTFVLTSHELRAWAITRNNLQNIIKG